MLNSCCLSIQRIYINISIPKFIPTYRLETKVIIAVFKLKQNFGNQLEI